MTPMRFTSFSVEGFRSIKKLELTERELGHGPVVVLYGKNGAGKSNILAAMQVFWRLLGLAVQQDPLPSGPMQVGAELGPADVRCGAPGASMRFKATVVFDEPLDCAGLRVHELTGDIRVHAPAAGSVTLEMTRLAISASRLGAERALVDLRGGGGHAEPAAVRRASVRPRQSRPAPAGHDHGLAAADLGAVLFRIPATARDSCSWQRRVSSVAGRRA